MPPPEFFPFDTLEAVVAKPTRLQSQQDAVNPPQSPGSNSATPLSLLSLFTRPTDSSAATHPTNHLTIPKYPPTPPTNPFANFPPTVSTALQYSTAEGYPPLKAWVENFTFNHLHAAHGGIPYANPAVLLSCGNTDAINKVFETLLQDGDTLLVEKFTYLPAVQAATPRGATPVGVDLDDQGICIDGVNGLRSILESWPRTKWGRSGKRKPRVLYTIAVGQNPTGVTTPMSRKKQIYDLCEEHDIIIVEDDPYWYMQYTPATPTTTPATTPADFLKSLVPSYLTIDPSGRVLRLDTFSKTLAPGCRLGWITGQPALLERLLRATEAGSAAPSGFAQALVAELLTRHWGADAAGFLTYISTLRERYREKMRAMVSVLDGARFLPTVTEEDDGGVVVTNTEILAFTPPAAGMFIWVRILYGHHPLFGAPFSCSAAYLAGKLWEWLVDPQYGYGVMVGPGKMFSAAAIDGGEGEGDEYFRVAFALLGVQEGREAAGAVVEGIRAFWGLSMREVERIGMEDGDGEGEGAEGEVMREVVMGC